MMMRKMILTACLSGAALMAHAGATHVTVPADVDDVKQIFRLLNFEKTTLSALRRNFDAGNQANPATAVDLDTYLSFVTFDAIDDHFAPVFAKYMSRDYARQLIPALQSQAGKLSMRLDGIESESGLSAARAAFAKFSPADQRAVLALRKSNPYLSFVNAQSNAIPEDREVFKAWSAEVMHVRARQVRKELAEMIEAELKIEKDEVEDTTAPPPSGRLNPTGMRSFDRQTIVEYESIRKFARLSRRIARDNAQLDLGSIMKPANLITREGLEAGNLTILTAEAVFDEHAKASDALSAEYDRAIANIPMTAEIRQQLSAQDNKNMTQIIDIQLRESEHLRTLLELAKQVLALCETQLGKSKLSDGKLVFSNDEGVQGYNTLLAKMRNENEEIKKIEEESFERRRQSAERLKAM